METLGTYDITNTNEEVDEKNLVNFLSNMSTHTIDGELYYLKVGNSYYLSGRVDFGSDTTLDILPEEAVSDFVMLSNDGIITGQQGSTILTAQTSGEKIISGFYIANNGENR